MSPTATVHYTYMADGRIKCTFVCHETGVEFVRFFKKFSAAKAATTKFEKAMYSLERSVA